MNTRRKFLQTSAGLVAANTILLEASPMPEQTAPSDRVRFGMRVTLELDTGVRQVFRLVGEDEADAAQGLLSWMAPLAQSLLGKEAGESVPYQGREARIVSIEL